MSRQCQICKRPIPNKRLQANPDERHCSKICKRRRLAQNTNAIINAALASAYSANEDMNDPEITNLINQLEQARPSATQLDTEGALTNPTEAEQAVNLATQLMETTENRHNAHPANNGQIDPETSKGDISS